MRIEKGDKAINNKEKISKFIKELFCLYFEKRDFNACAEYLDLENISWIGTGAHEVCSNIAEASELFNAEKNSWEGHYKILELWFECRKIDELRWFAFGEVKLEEQNSEKKKKPTLSRFTGIFNINEKEEIHVRHVHFSMPNPGQGAGDFTLKSIDEMNSRLFTKKNEDLLITKTRYEVVMENSDILVFDYIFETDELLYSEDQAEKHNFSIGKFKDVNTLIHSDIVHPKSREALQKVYDKIKDGALIAEGSFIFYDENKNEIVYEIFVKNIFDDEGHPLRAIGTMRNITEQYLLGSEKEYRKSMVSDKILAYEANITDDSLITIEDDWVNMIKTPKFKIFSELVEYQLENLIHPEDCDRFREFFTEKNIIRKLSTGKNRMILEYRRKNKNGEYHWIETTMNVIQDELIGDIKIRCYFKDISELKEKERKAQEEKRFYETLLPESAIVYEVNITKDFFIKGQESWPGIFGIRYSNSYSEMISALCHTAVHPDDQEEFNKKFSREYILSAYYGGKTQLYHEYRRENTKGEFIWIACTTNLMEDFESSDVKSYSYMEDIDEEKKKELELIHRSEHDGLTGLYNKVTTESLIKKYLASKEGSQGNHCIFVIDVDYFKNINDEFGHIFGDLILGKIALNLKEAFRDQDIVGRIGGDEFLVLMKNVTEVDALIKKAEQLSRKIRERYVQRGKKCQVSISMGISIFPSHGKNFEELYQHADTALYHSKNKGRDCYSLFDKKLIAFNNFSEEKESNESIRIKAFGENVSESVFKILHRTSDKEAGINMILEVIGNYYGASRAYVFENDEDGLTTRNTFEWCAQDIEPQIDFLQNIAFEEIGDYENSFNLDGIYYLPDATVVTTKEKVILEKQGIKGMIHLKMTGSKGTGKEGFKGFIGFDYCDFIRILTKKELDELKVIGEIIEIFIMEMRSVNKNKEIKDIALSIVDGLDTLAYVIDAQTHEVLFINAQTKKISPQAKVGNLCYENFWGRETPCEICPIKGLDEGKNNKCTLEIYNPNFNIWTKSTATWIKWVDGKTVCLLNNVDITELKTNKN